MLTEVLVLRIIKHPLFDTDMFIIEFVYFYIYISVLFSTAFFGTAILFVTYFLWRHLSKVT
jgi:hypothetical protein